MKIKKIIKKLFNIFGLDIIKYNSDIKHESFDKILLDKVSNNPIIFDIGANSGQSINRFSKIVFQL